MLGCLPCILCACTSVTWGRLQGPRSHCQVLWGSPRFSAPGPAFSQDNHQPPGYCGPGLCHLNPRAQTETHRGKYPLCDMIKHTHKQSLQANVEVVSSLSLEVSKQKLIYVYQNKLKRRPSWPRRSFQLQVYLILCISLPLPPLHRSNIPPLTTRLSDTQAGFAQSGEIQFEYLLHVRTKRKKNKLINKELLFRDFQATLCLKPNHA